MLYLARFKNTEINNLKAYLINLDRAEDRLIIVKNNLEQAGFNVVRVSAIDGKNLSKPYYNYSRIRYRLYHGKKTVPAELGCYFSHLKALKTFLESNDSHAIILEDDIFVKNNAKDILEESLKYQSNWDLLRLTGLHYGLPLSVFKLSNSSNLAVNITRQTGAGAYLVNRKAATILIKALSPMRVPYDHAFDREWFFGIKTLSLVPYPFQQNTGAFDSQIADTASFKYPVYLRYWTVLPYRIFNEVTRVIYRSYIYLKTKIKNFFLQ